MPLFTSEPVHYLFLVRVHQLSSNSNSFDSTMGCSSSSQAKGYPEEWMQLKDNLLAQPDVHACVLLTMDAQVVFARSSTEHKLWVR